jgi:tetratricopeptide (TPR) repeat protein
LLVRNKLRPTTFVLGLAAVLCLVCLGCNRDPMKFIAKGDESFGQAKYPDALIYYGRAVQLNAHLPEAHYKLAQTHLKMKSWSAAYAELSRTVELQPENWPAQVDLGRLEFVSGKRQNAKDRAEKILKSDPNNIDAQLLLADSDAALGDLKTAIEEANVAVKMAPDRASSYLNLAQLQVRDGDPKSAEANMLKAQALDPKSIISYMLLGGFYAQQKRIPEAEKQFQAAISTAPGDPSPRAALAGLYSSQNDPSKAEQVLTDAKNQLSSNPTAYRLLGDSYLARGQVDKALEEFASLSTKYPDDFSVQKTYIQILIRKNRLDEAKALNDGLLNKIRQDPEATILNGQIQLLQHKPDDALATLQSAVKMSPDNAVGHYQLGLALDQKGIAQQAEQEWREAVRIRPTYVEAWVALATRATRKSDWRELEDLSDQIKKYAPNVAEGYLFHATARINQSDPIGAEADLLNLQRIAPKSPMYYVKMGDLRIAQQKLDDAEGFFRQALDRDPNNMEAILGLIRIDVNKNKIAEANKLIQDQIKKNPNNPALYFVQAELQLQTKQLSDAEISLNHVLELEKNNVSAMWRLAQLNETKGQNEKAISLYQSASELSPRDARILVSLGEAYERVGNWQQAQSTYQKALALAPENPVAANNLSYLLLEHGGSPTVALTLAQTARKGMPNVPNSADTLGWAYYNNAAYSIAAPLFEQAVKAKPDNQTYRYHLGLTYQKLNDAVRAKTEFEKVVALNPNSPLAEQAKRFL